MIGRHDPRRSGRRPVRRLAGFILGILMLTPSSGLGKPPDPPFPIPNSVSTGADRKLTLPATEEEIDREIGRLRSRLGEVRSRAIPASGPGAAGDADGPASALPEEVAEWKRLDLEIIYLLETHLAALQNLKEIRKSNTERAVERTDWPGFAEKPPYPASFLETRFDAIKDKQFERQMAAVRLQIAEGQLRDYLKNLEREGAELRLAEERLASIPAGESRGRALWLRDLARRRHELAETGALSLETQRLVLIEDLEGRRETLPFLERRYRLAEAASPISREDLDRKLGALEGPRNRLRDQLNRALGEEEAANLSLERARILLHRAQESVPPGVELPPARRGRLELLKSAQEAEKVRLDTARLKVEITQGMLRQLTVEQQVWEDRFRAGKNGSADGIPKRIEEVRQNLEHIRLWKNSLEDGLDKIAPLLRAQREKRASGGRSKEEAEVAQTFLDAYADRESLYRQALQALNRSERVAERWWTDLTALQERQAQGRGIVERMETLLAPLGTLWNTELYVAEESAIVDNRKISRPISVTVGKVSKALLILLAGLFFAGRMKGPVERFAARRFRADESATKRIGRKWSFFTFIALFTVALASVNIPLAVFAFLGGTLAIAAGFGAQHLIGNFISSVILLFDRTIQVGDVVEIEGHRGRVTGIGMRSSSILRFDGVEMLVPNSQFLGQRVTNWTHSDKHVRYEISVGVAYSSPARKVSDLILAVVTEDPRTLKDPPPVVLFEEFGDSALLFRVHLWLVLDAEPENRLVLSDLRHRIKETLDGSGIVIAFPQRDIHLEAKSPIPVTVVEPDASLEEVTGTSPGRMGTTARGGRF